MEAINLPKAEKEHTRSGSEQAPDPVFLVGVSIEMHTPLEYNGFELPKCRGESCERVKI